MLPGKNYTAADITRVLRRRWKLLVLVWALAAAATLLITDRLPDWYRSETLILVVPQRVPESYVRSTVTTRIEDRLQSISQQILSRTRLERVIQDFDLYQRERTLKPMEDVVEQMRKDIDVQIVKGDAFQISYVSKEPRTAMRVAERLASLFIEENLRDREVLAQGTSEFLDSQLADARRRLIEHEKKLEAYRRQFSGELPTQVTANLAAQQNVQVQLQTLTEALDHDRERRLVLERALAEASLAVPPRTVPTPTDDGRTAGGVAPFAGGTAAQQLAEATRFLRALELRLKPEHPDIIQTKRTIRELQKKADAEALERPISPELASDSATVDPEEAQRRRRISELRSELRSVEAQMADRQAEEKRLRAQNTVYQARLEATPTRESELIELTRDYETLQGAYTSLLAKKEDAQVSANLERRQIGEQFKVLDPARLPERPFSPKRLQLNLFGLLFGLGLGVGLVALMEVRDSTLKTDEDVVTTLNLPVLATIPTMLTTIERKRQRRRRMLISATTTATIIVAAIVFWSLKS